jgi:hypothetical protein
MKTSLIMVHQGAKGELRTVRSHIVEALPTLVKDGIVEWDQLYAVTAESCELADHRALPHGFGRASWRRL